VSSPSAPPRPPQLPSNRFAAADGIGMITFDTAMVTDVAITAPALVCPMRIAISPACAASASPSDPLPPVLATVG
jgi:hypothetical protein